MEYFEGFSILYYMKNPMWIFDKEQISQEFPTNSNDHKWGQKYHKLQARKVRNTEWHVKNYQNQWYIITDKMGFKKRGQCHKNLRNDGYAWVRLMRLEVISW